MSLNIRVAEGTDAKAVCAIYSPLVRDTAISFELAPPSVEEMARRIRETSRLHPWLVCEKGGRVVGYAYATGHRKRAAYRWAVEVSLFVHEKHRRAGVGKALYAALLGILRLQGFYHAFAIITVPNPPSIAFHERMGFKMMGTFRKVGFKLGAWRDTGWWHLELREPSGKPPPPRPFSAVRGSPRVMAALGESGALPGRFRTRAPATRPCRFPPAPARPSS